MADEASLRSHVLGVVYGKPETKVGTHGYVFEDLTLIRCNCCGCQAAAALALSRLSADRSNRAALAKHDGLVTAVCAALVIPSDTKEVKRAARWRKGGGGCEPFGCVVGDTMPRVRGIRVGQSPPHGGHTHVAQLNFRRSCERCLTAHRPYGRIQSSIVTSWTPPLASLAL